MKLLDLFKAVKEEGLSKQQLEDYHKELSEMYQMLHLELGEVKKKKAIFMLQFPEAPTTMVMRNWAGSEFGLREIELKSYIRATSTTLSSLKNRLYSTY